MFFRLGFEFIIFVLASIILPIIWHAGRWTWKNLGIKFTALKFFVDLLELHMNLQYFIHTTKWDTQKTGIWTDGLDT